MSSDGRFAPSPTGTLHVGNLRTALAAYLAARATGSRFCIRIDDLDPGRSRSEYVRSQLDDLAQLGIVSDEPPVLQSQRGDRYQAALEQLWEKDLLYPCFCTRAQVVGAGVACSCGDIAKHDADRRVAHGDAHAIRARTNAATVSFTDERFGLQSVELTDMVVWRKDDVAAYHLACIVDDIEQGFELVVRGSDLLESSASQIWLATALNMQPPRYAHVALLVDDAGRRLGKRHQSVTLAQLTAAGVAPSDLRDMLAASLGLCQRGDRLAWDQLITSFDLTGLPVKDSEWIAEDTTATPRINLPNLTQDGT